MTYQEAIEQAREQGATHVGVCVEGATYQDGTFDAVISLDDDAFEEDLVWWLEDTDAPYITPLTAGEAMAVEGVSLNGDDEEDGDDA